MLIAVEQIEAIIRAVAAEEGFTSTGVPYESTWGPKIVVRCRQAAMPSGQEAEDMKTLNAFIKSPPSVFADDASAALERLTAKSAMLSSQVAEDRDLIIAHVTHDCADGESKDRCRACQMSDAAVRLAAQAQSAETYRANWQEAERGRMALLAERDALKKERDEAKQQARLGWERHAEKDRAYGEVIAQRDACERDLMQHFEAKNRAMAEVVRLRNVLGNIATACEGKDLRALNPEAAALAQRKVIEDVWRWATAAAGGEVVPTEGLPPEMIAALKAEPSQPIRIMERDEFTVRDEFAKAAMQALYTSTARQNLEDDTAKRAYRMADAMLSARGSAVDLTPGREKEWETEARHDAARQTRNDPRGGGARL